VRVAGQGLHGDHQPLAIGGGERDLDPELIALADLALGQAFDLPGKLQHLAPKENLEKSNGCHFFRAD
jgi:hypothetical protein